MPLQIGAIDIAFPKLNMASYQFHFIGGIIMFVSFFIPGGAARAGWTSSTRPVQRYRLKRPNFSGSLVWCFLFPLTAPARLTQIVTIIQLRAPGLVFGCGCHSSFWSQFVVQTSLNPPVSRYPPLESAA